MKQGGNNPEGIGGKSGKKKKDCKNLNLSFYNEDSEEAKESAKETAQMIGISSVQVNKMRTILNYAIKRNANKGRVVTAGDKFRLFKLLDQVGEHGGNKKSKNINTKDFVLIDTPSAKKTAKLIGTSDMQVTKMRTRAGWLLPGISSD